MKPGRDQKILPYFHCIFTVPGAFDILVPRNERTFYGLVFSAASWTLKRLAKKYFGGDPGIIAVLHTWGQTMWHHPYLHCIVTGGALSFDRRRWVHSQPGFLFDVFEMSELFRGRFCKLLRKARLTFEGKAAHLADGAALERFVTEQQSRD